MSDADIRINEFSVNFDGGPKVTATRVGSSFNFKWPGGSGVVMVGYDQATFIAQGLAEQVAEIEPLRQELERRRDDIAQWLDDQREPTQ